MRGISKLLNPIIAETQAKSLYGERTREALQLLQQDFLVYRNPL